jgi:hypothetical protein
MRHRFFVTALLVAGSRIQPALADSPAVPRELSRYKSWRSFNNIPLPANLASRCYVPPTVAAYMNNEKSEKGPHKAKVISVFFNEQAKNVVSYLRDAKFPSGTVIVKEKKLSADSPAVELGAMLKHSNGEWEYLFVNSENQNIRGENKGGLRYVPRESIRYRLCVRKLRRYCFS